MLNKITNISYNTSKAISFKNNSNTNNNDMANKTDKIVSTVYHAGALSALAIATAVSNKNNKGFLKNLDDIGGPIIDVALYSGALLGGIIANKDNKALDVKNDKNSGTPLVLFGLGGLAGFAGKLLANTIKKLPNKFDKTWEYSLFSSLAFILPYLLKIIINDIKTAHDKKKNQAESAK